MTNQLILFPKLEDVFNQITERHSEVFMPVVSIPKALINKNWEGYFHILQFNEDPYNRETVKYFTEYCTDAMISFTISDGKYDFDTDLGYFDVTDDWKEYQIETKEKFERSKKDFLSNGNQFNIAEIKIGGEPEWWQGDATPKDPSGNKMIFVTEIDTYPFCEDSCDKKIYVFYSHEHNLIVHLYQIT
ncbi:hypothetical protein HNQ02_003791 [Flavobacterium sp. 7E]|uniref:hypothetical protein n=1 Tax=Flavobacterium sp. 7E TaxID=2735898 RepID=UPI00157148EC|nr:hypothetical protein [Flavobacterium sp. 7E]NRS90844.1 hypothetical protein [Flavobacterium sp. 7E]